MELRIEGLSKTYPNGVKALEGVSLTIPCGRFGLLGPNGASKSSLMRTLATLQEPDSGAVRLGDIDVLRQKDELRRASADPFLLLVDRVPEDNLEAVSPATGAGE